MAEVLNFEVKILHGKLNRMIEEASQSTSANVNEFEDYDVVRHLAYLTELRYDHDHMLKSKKLDIVEVGPKRYTLRDDPVVDAVESEAVNKLVEMYSLMRDELVSSKTARRAQGWNPYDSVRFLAFIEYIEDWFADYVANATPIDYVKSSPRTDVAKAGRTGIDPKKA